MKIAMVSEHASPLAAVGGVDAGGQNVHVAELARALAARGHELVVYTRRDEPGLPERAPLCPGVTVEYLAAGPPRPLPKDELLPHLDEMIADLHERLPRFGPALVHAHFWMSGTVTGTVARELGLPWVQTFHALGVVKQRHQGAADTSPACRQAAERRIARTATRLTASCTDELRELVALGATRARVDVIPSGVDLTAFTRGGDSWPRSRRPRLLSIGRLVQRKGVDDAIRALADVPDAELLVAGGPDRSGLANDPEAARLRQLADALGIADRVRWLGQVPHPELPALIRSADAVLCLPWYEPFGIVPLEAMACGVPVIGTAVGGLLDTVVDGQTGCLAPPRRPDAVARAVRMLLGDPHRRDAYGAAGARRARDYSWAQVAATTERSYLHAVIDGGARAAEHDVRTGEMVTG